MSAQRSVGVYQPRSRRAQIAEAMAGLRQRACALLASAVWRLLGGGFLALAAALLIALAGYDATDPSFDVATGKDASNWLGSTGSFTADFMLRFWGLAAVGFAATMSAWAWQMLSRAMPPRRFAWRAGALFFGLLVCACGLGALPLFGSFPSGAGGIPGRLSWTALESLSVRTHWHGLPLASSIAMGLCGLALVLWAAGANFRTAGIVAGVAGYGVTSIFRAFGAMRGPKPAIRRPVFEADDDDEDDLEDTEVDEFDEIEEPVARARAPRETNETLVRRGDERRRKLRAKSELQPALNLAEGEYQLPPLGLISEPPPDITGPVLSDDALKENARMLEAVLGDFGVRGRISEVRPGPVVTLYEFEPAAGVKSSRVSSLSEDIARSMSAVAARVAVIPGRNVIGIELPNPRREKVYLRELLSAPEYEKSRAPLTLALGKTIGGEPVMADLAKMPHLLIAGTTGSGKSVALNTMILSLL